MQLADRLDQLHPGWPPARLIGAVTLIAASIDGLMLHYMLDPAMPVGEALGAMEDLLGEGQA